MRKYGYLLVNNSKISALSLLLGLFSIKASTNDNRNSTNTAADYVLITIFRYGGTWIGLYHDKV